MSLTPHQVRVLELLAQIPAERHRRPCVRDVATGLGCSMDHATNLVSELAERGYLRRRLGAAWTITPLGWAFLQRQPRGATCITPTPERNQSWQLRVECSSPN